MRYLPHTPDEINEMLAAIGAPSVDALFEPIPPCASRSRYPSSPPSTRRA
jgi:glycine dehydrogenase subunit 1